ncbi:MAG: hypothetical protein ACKVQW_15030, partial [Pyrinomonadaceae bacterium]
MTNSTKSDRYMAVVIAAGVVCIAVALALAEWENANIYLFLMAAFTVGIGSRMTIQIPRFKSHVSVSDTLIFVTLLLYGGGFAIMLAAIEASVSSWKFCNRKVTVFFNAATMALSTAGVVLALDSLRFAFGTPNVYGYTDDLQTFVIALSVVALTQFLFNTTLAAVHGS